MKIRIGDTKKKKRKVVGNTERNKKISFLKIYIDNRPIVILISAAGVVLAVVSST